MVQLKAAHALVIHGLVVKLLCVCVVCCKRLRRRRIHASVMRFTFLFANVAHRRLVVLRSEQCCSRSFSKMSEATGVAPDSAPDDGSDRRFRRHRHDRPHEGRRISPEDPCVPVCAGGCLSVFLRFPMYTYGYTRTMRADGAHICIYTGICNLHACADESFATTSLPLFWSHVISGEPVLLRAPILTLLRYENLCCGAQPSNLHVLQTYLLTRARMPARRYTYACCRRTRGSFLIRHQRGHPGVVLPLCRF